MNMMMMMMMIIVIIIIINLVDPYQKATFLSTATQLSGNWPPVVFDLTMRQFSWQLHCGWHLIIASLMSVAVGTG